jgi:hypothetical protein
VAAAVAVEISAVATVGVASTVAAAVTNTKPKHLVSQRAAHWGGPFSSVFYHQICFQGFQ